jgi:hypothetical protein
MPLFSCPQQVRAIPSYPNESSMHHFFSRLSHLTTAGLRGLENKLE